MGIKVSPGAAIFGRDMLFDTLFHADSNKIGEQRHLQTDCITECKNHSHHDGNYTIGDIVLLRKDYILHKRESLYERDPWAITTVHTNGTIRAQHGTNMHDSA
jgi:hypothetical protein